MSSEDFAERLVIDPELWKLWINAGLPQPLGLAAATDAQRACVLVVTPEQVDPSLVEVAAANKAFRKQLNVETRVITAGARSLTAVVRDWLYQVAEGSGRGVELQLHGDFGDRLTVLVRAIDSSAREVAMRLNSMGGPAALESIALARTLGHSDVIVRDVEQPGDE